MLKKYRLLGVVVAIAAVGITLSPGLTSARASAADYGVVPRSQHFQLMLNSALSVPVTEIPVMVYNGPVTDYGTDMLGPKGTSAKLELQMGTINFNKIDYKYSNQQLNPVTCVSVSTQGGTYSIKGGTGAYTGIHGYGTFHDTITAIFGRNSSDACSHKVPPQSIQLIDSVSGPIWL